MLLDIQRSIIIRNLESLVRLEKTGILHQMDEILLIVKNCKSLLFGFSEMNHRRTPVFP
jgi:hypothetical protein